MWDLNESIVRMCEALEAATRYCYVCFIIDVTGSYRKGFTTSGWFMALSFLIPFLQYCFKPWRNILIKRRTQSFEIPSPISPMDEREEEPPETTPFTYNNPAFEGSSLDMSSNVMAKIQHKRRTRSFQVPSPISKLDGQ
ncbi:hypothetical protein QZH41_017204, partial [Actinostola sp. cb2023]